ncbi:hypothetical protein [Chitinibacter sp. ZOR0017]|uniref:hypothetical protein n=1 Tax=Chitinibacter sp. ZOR0017 TaxID=1339254 RepID=UPI0012E0984A|nr:hypothetical protein [Chitinibacter sp. ZOR0017]
MRHLIPTLCILATSTVAMALSSAERQVLLESIRPEASRQAGQAVRFRVEQLNHTGNWAVIVGGLMAAEGKTLDWNKAAQCDPDLDKMLWVVAKKTQQRWQVEEMYICSPEPPYWYLKPKVAFARPCQLYAGLQLDGRHTVEQQCQQYQARRQRQAK